MLSSEKSPERYSNNRDTSCSTCSTYVPLTHNHIDGVDWAFAVVSVQTGALCSVWALVDLIVYLTFVSLSSESESVGSPDLAP